MAAKRKPRRIVVALWTGNASGRDLLSGVLLYVQEHPFWDITLLQLPNDSRPTIDTIVAAGVDGVITSDSQNPDVRRIVAETGAAVVTTERRSNRPVSDVCIDHLTKYNYSIGRLGGEYLLSVGRFNSYGFVCDIAPNESNSPLRLGNREKGFRDTIAAAGFRYDSFLAYHARHRAGNSVKCLHDWLARLQKPAAVMCFYDPYAVQVLHACARLGLEVPTQVSVLGVDNDAMLCETSKPSLSSIDPDHRRIGYQMARHMNALLRNHRLKEFLPRYTVEQVVVRASTKVLAPSASLVRKALNFIAAHALEGIGVEDVVDHLGVSRRLAFLRFHEVEHRTIRQSIEEIRLDVAARRLRTSQLTAVQIARSCGYNCFQTFATAFRKRFGASPATYRAQRKTDNAPPATP